MSVLSVPTPPTPEQVALLLEDYLARARDALVEAEVPVNRVVLSPGTAASWDDCCEGQLWTRLVSLVPWNGSPGAAASRCGPLWWVATVELGVLRCAATVDSRGNAPSPLQVTIDGQYTIRDAMLTLPAVNCHPATMPPGPSWAPLPTEGGCTGGAWTFTCKIDACRCED